MKISPLMVAVWIALIAAPFVMSAAAFAQIPAGVEQIPTNFGFDGAPNGYSAPTQLFVLAAIMAGCNVLMALCYAFSDTLYDHGMVHGVSRKTTRPVLLGCAIFLDIITAACLIYIINATLAAL